MPKRGVFLASVARGRVRGVDMVMDQLGLELGLELGGVGFQDMGSRLRVRGLTR